MSTLTARSLLPGMVLLLASCSSTQSASPTKPTTFAGGSAVAITVKAVASTQAAPPLGCPVATPFIMPFLVTVTPLGGVTVVVTSISTQFTGTGNITAPPVTLPAPIPTTQFGSALEQAKNPQIFPINVCRGSSSGTVVFAVGTSDPFGRSFTNTVVVAVQ